MVGRKQLIYKTRKVQVQNKGGGIPGSSNRARRDQNRGRKDKGCYNSKILK